MAGHAFHWRHGWIPLDHEAALKKTRGDRKAAAAMLSDAHGGSAGIRSRRDVAAALRDLPNVPSRDRIAPKHELIAAARQHNMEHLLPSSWQSAKAGPPRREAALPADLLRDFAGGSAEPHLVTDEHGTHFSAERQALHDAIIRHHVEGHTAQAHPSFVMLGGGPASGKSKAKDQAALDFPDAIQIDPDEIKKMLPEYGELHPDAAASFVHEESSYLAKQVTAAALKSRANVVLDAVGNTSVDSVRKKVDNARNAGYAVHGRYVTIPIDEAQQRALERGQKSGRVVHPTVIENSHRSVSEVFPALLDHFDTAALHDNTKGWKTVLTKHGDQPAIVHDKAAWHSFLQKRHAA